MRCAPIVGTHVDPRPIFSMRRSSLAGKLAFAMMHLPEYNVPTPSVANVHFCKRGSAGQITSKSDGFAEIVKAA